MSFGSIGLGTLDGLVTGTAQPPYIAWEFIYRRATALTRNGFKRFAGVTEEDVDQAGNVQAGILANLVALADDLEQPLTGPGSQPFSPVIYGRPIPSNPTPRIGFVSQVQFLRVTTQNSRKPWG